MEIGSIRFLTDKDRRATHSYKDQHVGQIGNGGEQKECNPVRHSEWTSSMALDP